MSLRGIAALTVALAAVTGTAFAVQEHDRREARAGDSSLSQQRYVAARIRPEVSWTFAFG